jgi:hypothetical protein
MFGKQTLTANHDRTLRGFFTYGAAAIATPSTGSAPPLAYGSTLAGAGAALTASRQQPPRCLKDDSVVSA